MALQKQNVSINFSEGIDTKTDNKLTKLGKLQVLENGVFKKTGRISKRNGYSVLSQEVKTSSNTITSGQALSNVNDELGMFSSDRFFSYASSVEGWVDKGSAKSIALQTKDVIKNSYAQTNPTSAVNTNTQVFAWEDSRGGVRMSAVDVVSGVNLVYDVEVSSTGSRPKVVAIENDLMIVYVKGTDLCFRSVSKYAPTTLQAEVTLTSDLNASPNYDAVAVNGRVYFAYYNDVNTISIRYREYVAAATSGATIIAEAASGGVSIATDTSINLWIAWNDGAEVAAKAFLYNLTTLLAQTTIHTTVDIIDNISIIVNSDVSTIHWEVHATANSNHFVQSKTMDISGTLGNLLEIRSVGLGGKAFVAEDKVFVPVIHDSELQSTMFVLAEDMSIVSKIAPNNVGGLIDNHTLSNIDVASNTHLIPLSKKSTLSADNGTTFTLTGVSGAYLDFESNNRYQSTEMGGLHVSGGIGLYYDGVKVVEDGFNVFPEGLSITYANSSGGLSTGTFQYVACYEWTDNYGQIHRSAPSPVVEQTTLAVSGINFTANTYYDPIYGSGSTASKVLSSVSNFTGLKVGQIISGTGIQAGTVITALNPGANTITMSLGATATATGVTINTTYTNKNTITIPTLRLTARTDNDVRIVVYRTLANGSVFYRCTTLTSPILNDITIDSVSFEDTTTDYVIQSNDLLYTTGGVLENIAPPASTLSTTYANRIVLSGLEDPLAFTYSKQKAEGYPVEFSDFFVSRVDPRGGDITALGALDNYLIIFKRSSIFVVTGTGPNDLGEGQFSEPTLITTDVGCDNPNTVTIVPDGLMFKSSKGIYLLSRSLSVTYIGAQVEDYNDLEITSSILMSDVNEVRFTTSDDVCLVYNYYYDNWSTFTNHTAEDCTIWNNRFVFLNPNGEVWVEEPGVFTDNGEAISLSITTGWISLAGVQGYERIYRAIILGEYRSQHRLQFDVAFNYNPYFTQTGLIDINDTYVLNTYGSQTYGDDVYGGEYPLYQFKNHLTIQKCQSIRFRFSDIQDEALGYGEGFNLANLTLEVGIKATPRKMSVKNSFSTSG